MNLRSLTPLALGLLVMACDSSSDTLTVAGTGSTTATATAAGSTTSTGGAASGTGTAATGTAGTSGTPVVVTPGSYALPPPSECSNQTSVQGCMVGNATSTCGGVCSNDYGPTSSSACETGKSGVPLNYACPRDMLLSSEMVQAAIDDGYGGMLNYAVAGHDQDNVAGGLDYNLPDACCQCYQLVYEVPTYLAEATLTPPKPLIVQSFNTAASGGKGFDIYMGAGGLGAFNACGPTTAKPLTVAGRQLYTGYPNIGQAFSGGVKLGPDSLNCANGTNALTDAVIADAACQAKVTSACNEIVATNATLQEETRKSCIQGNQSTGYYHENWNVYAKRVACPAHLTEVTGCKLVDTSLPAADPNVQTVAQAAAAGFLAGYHTTTMQDCCMPTCAWKNNVHGTTVDGYNSFYSCLSDGTVWSQGLDITAYIP